MASSTPNRIVLSGGTTHKEYQAAGAITPGMICAIDANGKIAFQATAADTSAPALFARENLEAGDGIGDAYAADDLVQAEWAKPGAEIYAWLDTGENVANGAELEVADNGYLQAVTTGKVVAQAMEAVNAIAAALRIRVRIQNA
jgi:hypothetical protein